MGCGICGAEFDPAAYRCQYCDGEFCHEHRFPEFHNCDNIEAAPSPPFISPDETEGEQRTSEEQTGQEVDEYGRIEYWWREDRDEQPFESIEPQTLGTAKEFEGDPSPGVSLDGSIDDDGPEEPAPVAEDVVDVENDTDTGAVLLLVALILVIAALGALQLGIL